MVAPSKAVRRGPIRRSIGWLWKWSLVLTLPACLMFGYWLHSTSKPYRDFGLRHQSGEGAGMLAPIMKLQWEQMWRHARLAVYAPKDSAERRVTRVELALQEGNEQHLNGRLPESGREYVEARLRYPDGRWEPSEVRYRGDYFWHWAMEKKSWRIKAKKSQLWNGMRRFNMIVPKSPAIVEGHLSYWLARDMGLIAPRSDVGELLINGKSRGLHTLVEQPEELLLRSNGRMPTDLYVGELVGTDVYPGNPAQLFRAPQLWSKAAANNHYDLESFEPLAALCSAVGARGSEQAARDLRALIDVEAMARFAVYRILCQSGHYDDAHNWRLYYDPWKLGFEAVVWDPNAWHRLWAPNAKRPFFHFPVFSELDVALAKDHLYRFAIHTELVRYLQAGGAERLMEEYNTQVERTHNAVRRDPAMVQYFIAYDVDQVEQDQAAMRETIASYLSEVRSVHLEDPIEARGQELLGGPEGALTLRIAIDGWRPAAGIELKFAQDLPELGTWSLEEEGGDTGGRSKRLMKVERVDARTLRIHQALLSATEVGPGAPGDHIFRYRCEVKPATYRLVGQWKQAAPELVESGLLTVGGATQALALGVEIEPVALEGEWGIFDADRALANENWSGVTSVQGLRVVEGDLVLEPGTVLSMGPGATLVVKGRLTAIGTKAAPIRVEPAEPEQEPWGAVVVNGPGANDSTLEHMELFGGSGYQDALQEYSGMLSLHAVNGVRMKACRLSNNAIVDDMLHAVYATDLVIEDCVFENAMADAIDLDGSQGVLRGLTVIDAGNDAVDFMMSSFVVLDSIFKRSGDKGLSIGENSQVLVLGSQLVHNKIGVQSKDTSSAWLRDCRFEAHGLFASALRKNWRYGRGGRLLLEDCAFEGGGSVESLKRSRVLLKSRPGEESSKMETWADMKRVDLWTEKAAAKVGFSLSVFEDRFRTQLARPRLRAEHLGAN